MEYKVRVVFPYVYATELHVRDARPSSAVFDLSNL